MAGKRRKDFSSLLNGKIKQAVRSLSIDRVSMKVGEFFTIQLPRSAGVPIATLSSGDPPTLGIAHLGGGRYVVTALAPVIQVSCIMQRSDFGGGAFGVVAVIQIVP